MKTIAVKDTTFQLLELLKQQEHASSFDSVIQSLVSTKITIPQTMFGALKSKGKVFTRQERDDAWQDKER